MRKILVLKWSKFLWFSKKKTLFYKNWKIWITLLQAIWCVLSKYDYLWSFGSDSACNRSWWNGFSGIGFFCLTYDIEINIPFFCNGVPYLIIIVLLYHKGYSPSMYTSPMVLFFISWCFCSRSEFCHIMWYYGYNKYILKITCSCTVCASLANSPPNLSYIICIFYKM